MEPGYPLPADAVPAVRSPLAPPAGASLPAHYPGCFACGSDHADGLLLRAVAGEGVAVTARVDITGAHQGAPGLAHGGIVATALDETQGFVLWLLASAGVTAKLEIQYRQPVPIGHTVVTRGWCTGIAGRKVFTAADMHLDDADGPLLAQSSGLFIVVGEEHFAPFIANAAGSVAGRVNPRDVRDHIGGTSINP
jgi:acyl-coenzyme A thioesterase PaaI-like protein